MLRRFMDRLRGRDEQPTAAAVPRDYTQEREDRREAQLSEEDRAWGAAAQQRDQASRERDQSPVGEDPTR